MADSATNAAPETNARATTNAAAPTNAATEQDAQGSVSSENNSRGMTRKAILLHFTTNVKKARREKDNVALSNAVHWLFTCRPVLNRRMKSLALHVHLDCVPAEMTEQQFLEVLSGRPQSAWYCRKLRSKVQESTWYDQRLYKELKKKKKEKRLRVCPINSTPIKLPVAAEDGIIYEKDAIERWFQICRKKGNAIKSPMTNLPIGDRLVRLYGL